MFLGPLWHFFKISRAAERGGRRNWPLVLRGLIIEDFNNLTARNALKCILSQSEGRNRKMFCSLRSQGGLIFSVLSVSLEKLSTALQGTQLPNRLQINRLKYWEDIT